MRTLLGLFVAFSCLFTCIATPASAQTENRTIDGIDYQVDGVRVGKGGMVSLADMYSPSHKRKEEVVYMPAGTRLLLLHHLAKDRQGRPVTLAVTDSGLLIYVRTDGTHFFLPAEIDQWAARVPEFVVAQGEVVVNTTNYGKVTITPTEIYEFKPLPGEDISILISKSKMMDAYTVDEWATVDIGHFQTIRIDELTTDVVAEPFTVFNLGAELQALVAKAAAGEFEQKQRDALLTALSTGSLADSKACHETLDIGMDLAGEIGAKLENMLSPVLVKLGMSGKYEIGSSYPKGLVFKIFRFKRADGVIEIREEQYFSADCSSLERLGYTVSETADSMGQITSSTLKDLGIPEGPNKQPIYRCRDEYMKLLDFYTNDEGLTAETATLAIAMFAKYKGKGSASTCPS